MLASAIVFAIVAAMLRFAGQWALARMSGFDANVLLWDGHLLESDGDWPVVAKRDGPSDESAFDGLPSPGRSEGSRSDDGARAVPASPHWLP